MLTNNPNVIFNPSRVHLSWVTHFLSQFVHVSETIVRSFPSNIRPRQRAIRVVFYKYWADLSDWKGIQTRSHISSATSLYQLFPFSPSHQPSDCASSYVIAAAARDSGPCSTCFSVWGEISTGDCPVCQDLGQGLRACNAAVNTVLKSGWNGRLYMCAWGQTEIWIFSGCSEWRDGREAE